ncbi:glycine--tRNA ligase subunit beta [Halarsenatibacter silvermanii]|uniref:Glycine--tRNA ligase beta subunit n=1 Tax=Halarsenatibacter silvermanii TaxID=321763 RepID=A0A1G9JTI6_9FIRM|nr:glycine--tRNA ligase subunit beta [Halarsenatibacter silvermanii]SDL40950.1 glycyl-tRNA synthetase beta chain [Halarsenatibacter silvermanii]
MADKLIFELGTEEIPAGMVAGLRNNLADDAEELLEDNRIDYEEIDVYSTPRRLVLEAEGVAEKQSDTEEVIRGPSEEIAFDDEGNPTKAAEGFARGQNVDLEEVIIRDGYLFVERLIEGRPAREVLAEMLPELVKNLSQPQTMRWGSGQFEFVRPIRWILALYGERVINFELAGLESDRITRGHRFLGVDSKRIESADDYFSRLADEYVIVDQNRRRAMILEQIKEIENEEDIEVFITDDLIQEVTNLIEFPAAFLGSFNPDFLKVPDEVLKTSMIEHQRYFPVKENDSLAASFISVRNGDEKHLENVIKGNEMVIRARLADAAFFYEEDRSVELEDFNQELKNIIYQEELGSIYDKVKRLEKLSRGFGQNLGLSEDKIQALKRAARLAKFDLATDMVDEFAKLQGVMGRIYAEDAGEEKPVAEAIEEHYLPDQSGGELPGSDVGAVLSIADKMDDIVSNFFAGNEPSGSHDPFALRRKGVGIIRILISRDWNITVSELIAETSELIGAEDEVRVNIRDFIRDRLESHLGERDIRYDIIKAVLEAGFDDITDCWKRCQALMNLRSENLGRFTDLIYGLQRCQNLAAQGEPAAEINPDLLGEEEEMNLHREYSDVKEDVLSSFSAGSYEKGLEKLVDLKDPIDNFLDNVVVMVDDEETRKNRLALLAEVSSLSDQVMDIGEIALDEDRK